MQTLTLYALNSNDGYHIATLQKQVNSALSRIRDSLMMSEFNYPVSEQICQARVRIALGELLKGKKMLYRANQNWLDKPETMPPALLGETILALYQLGEFEYAESLQSLLAEDEDRLLTTCIQVTRDDKTVQERRQRYQQLNDLGIKAYQSGELEQALGHFREALRRAPANTGAALNKIQVLLQLMQKHRKSPEFGAECKETLEVLEGIPLNPAQQDRFRKLRQEFNQIA